MGLLKKFFTNCAHPKGRMGRAMLKFMNLTHAPLTNWGLGLIEFQDGCRKSNLSGVRCQEKSAPPFITKDETQQVKRKPQL